MDNNFTCPFCGKEETLEHPNHWFDCLGGFFLNWPGCNEYVKRIAGNDAYKQQRCWTVLSYHIAHKFGLKPYNTGDDRTTIDFEKVLQNNMLPTPMEQIDNMVLFLGKNSEFLGHTIPFSPRQPNSLFHQVKAWIGAITNDNIRAITDALKARGFIEAFLTGNNEIMWAKLLLDGWTYFQSLQERNPESKQIFMAMQFNQEAREFVNAHLKPLAKELGFDLKLLDEIISEENLIDDKLRVEIKRSRILICDLTHHNRGAYWEAGYAEGLGIPVVYICREDVLKSTSKEEKPHFDVEHQVIYSWEKGNNASIQKLEQELKAKITLLTQ